MKKRIAYISILFLLNVPSPKSLIAMEKPGSNDNGKLIVEKVVDSGSNNVDSEESITNSDNEKEKEYEKWDESNLDSEQFYAEDLAEQDDDFDHEKSLSKEIDFENLLLDPNEQDLNQYLYRIIRDNDIYTPFAGVSDFLRTFSGTNKKCKRLAKTIDLQKLKAITKEYFVRDAFKDLSLDELNKELEKTLTLINKSFCMPKKKKMANIKMKLQANDDNLLEVTRKLLAELIIAGANPDLKFSPKYTDNSIPFLSFCITKNWIDLVKLLIIYGADVNEKDARGWPPLIHAICADKDLELIKPLLQNGAQLDELYTFRKSKASPLMVAVVLQREELVALLLEFNPDLTLIDPYGSTALDIAHSDYYEVLCFQPSDKSQPIIELIENYQMNLKKRTCLVCRCLVS